MAKEIFEMSQQHDHIIERFEAWWKNANTLPWLFVENVEKDQCKGPFSVTHFALCWCRETGITKMNCATGSICSGDPAIDRHHLILWNTESMFLRPWSQLLLPSFHWSTQLLWFVIHCCRAIIEPCNVYVSSPLCTDSYTATLHLLSSSQNWALSWSLFGCHVSSAISLQYNYVNIEIHLEAVIEQVGCGSCRLKSSKLRDVLGG